MRARALSRRAGGAPRSLVIRAVAARSRDTRLRASSRQPGKLPGVEAIEAIDGGSGADLSRRVALRPESEHVAGW